jgi:hypothetical protein
MGVQAFARADRPEEQATNAPSSSRMPLSGGADRSVGVKCLQIEGCQAVGLLIA